jgi:hypothetical protein
MIGGLNCESGGDVAGGLATGGDGWLIRGVIGGLYCDVGGDCDGGVEGGLSDGGVWLEAW